VAELFGPYRLQAVLGRGGMGEVWRAYDTVRGRTVALKRLPAALANDPDYRARFRRESELSARLNEPHIIPIHDFGEIDGRLYLDMRLVEGTDLAAELARCGRFDPARTVAVLVQVAAALAAAHRAGLVHRDIKPGNVLLAHPNGTEGGTEFVYVADFGIARTAGGSGQTSLTATGATVGTVDYMAPERFVHGLGDHRVDIYALGCLLYECLTGTRPFPGEGVLAQMHAHIHLPPPRPSEHPGVPAGFDQVVACAMAKNPDNRYPTASALAAAADAALHRRPVGRVAPTASTRVPAGAATSSANQPVAQAPPTQSPPTYVPPSRGADAPATHVPAAPAPTSDGSTETPVPGGRPHRRRRLPMLVAAATVVLVIGVAIVLTRGSASRTEPSAPTRQTGEPVGQSGQTGHTGPMRLTTAATIGVGAGPCGMALSRDGRRGYVASATDGTLAVIDTAAARVIATITVGPGACQVVADPNNDSRVYIGNYQTNTITTVDPTSSSVMSTLRLDTPPYGLAMMPYGSGLYTTAYRSNALTLVVPETGQTTATIPVGDYPYGLAITHDGHRAYVCNLKARTVSVVDTASHTVVASIGVGGKPIAATVTPDDRHVYVANNADNNASVIDTASNTVTATVPTGWEPKAVAASGDDRDVFVANYRANTVWVIDTASGTVAATSPVGNGPLSVVVAPDSRRAYVVNQGSNNVTALDVSFG
jgi:serine/threonine-protein kinase